MSHGRATSGPTVPAMAFTWSIIQALGGCAIIAREIHCGLTTVSNWQTIRGIPAYRWPALIRLGQQQGTQGITIETLRAASRSAVRARVERTRVRKS